MSVLLEFSIFPTDKGSSVSKYVSRVIEMIRKDYSSYKLTAMGTIIETETVEDALAVVKKSHDILAPYSDRIYASIKLDIQKAKRNRLSAKVDSIVDKIGPVNL